MKQQKSYSQGGDAQAISRIARTYYGSYRNMFEVHGWDAPGDKMMLSAPKLIVEAYGSIQRFEELHEPSELMSPMEAIYSDPPNVWLTSFYGFVPEEWGLLGFTDEGRRKSFLEGSKPGVLVVVYGAGQASKDELGKVIGIQQCVHVLGHAQQFMAPHEWNAKERDPERANKWNYAVKATRAWRVTPESRINVREFAPEATKTEAWQHIGARGVRLTKHEALNILHLDLQETDVYGEMEILAPHQEAPGKFLRRAKQAPSRKIRS